jgi:hypothetical protein
MSEELEQHRKMIFDTGYSDADMVKRVFVGLCVFNRPLPSSYLMNAIRDLASQSVPNRQEYLDGWDRRMAEHA